MVGIDRQTLAAAAAPILLFCLGLVAINATYSLWEDNTGRYSRQLASDQARLLENQINRSLTEARMLAAHIRTRHGNAEDVDEIVQSIHLGPNPISTLQLAPQGIISKTYPTNPDTDYLQGDLFRDQRHQADARKARESGRLRLSDPFELADSERAFIGYQPVFIDPQRQQFWGFITVLIRLQPLLQQTLLPTLAQEAYHFRLIHASPKTGQLELIAGQASLPDNLLSQHSIALPDDAWFLQIAYIGTTLDQTWIILLIALNICIALLAGRWLLGLIERQKTLEQQVSERTQALDQNNQQLQLEKLELKKFQNAVNDSGNCIVITDSQGVIEYVNSRFIEVTGYSAEEAIGHSPSVLKSDFTRREEHAELWRTISHGKKWRGERRNVRKDGAFYWSLMSISPIKDASGAITHFVSVSEDITENKELQLQVEKLAYHDPLTGLSNRRYFMKQLQQQCSLGERSNELAAVLYMDLDHFKMVNDTLGHGLGDELLKLVARKILSCLRDSDIPSRLGGDEFTILLPMLENRASASSVANKLVRIISEPFTLNGHNLQQSISIGISMIQGEGLSAEQVLRQADQALYSAKQNGRNRYQLYQETPPTMDAEQSA